MRIGICAGFGSPGSIASGSVIGGSGASPGFSIAPDREPECRLAEAVARCRAERQAPGAGGFRTWRASSNFSTRLAEANINQNEALQ
jgi:hypothetical protein